MPESSRVSLRAEAGCLGRPFAPLVHARALSAQLTYGRERTEGASLRTPSFPPPSLLPTLSISACHFPSPFCRNPARSPLALGAPLSNPKPYSNAKGTEHERVHCFGWLGYGMDSVAVMCLLWLLAISHIMQVLLSIASQRLS